MTSIEMREHLNQIADQRGTPRINDRRMRTIIKELLQDGTLIYQPITIPIMGNIHARQMTVPGYALNPNLAKATSAPPAAPPTLAEAIKSNPNNLEALAAAIKHELKQKEANELIADVPKLTRSKMLRATLPALITALQ